ncbi:MAG: zinc-binding dehydrogenase [Anaerolineae bacterium]|nr:zinc-binding dehydrogenase [Anaerolineae bacterium]
MAEMYTRSILTGVREVRFEQVPIPEPGPTQALIRVHACALCTWEQRVYAGVERDYYPLLGGHEVAGVLVKAGERVLTQARPGDRVVAAMLPRCGQCVSCRRGLDNLCDNAQTNGPGHAPAGPGGLSEYVLVEDYQLYPVYNDGVPFEELCLAEPLACVLRSVKKAAVQPADNVVVIGAGIMGLLHLTLAQRRGARVIVSEPNSVRAEVARALGATAIIDPTREDFVRRAQELTGQGPDVIFCTAGIPEVIEQAVRAVGKGGRVMMYASVHPRGSRITVDPNLFHCREITLTGTMSQSREDFLQAVSLLSNRIVDVRPLVSAVYPLSQLQDALEAAISPDTYRVVVSMQVKNPGRYDHETKPGKPQGACL